MVIETVTFPVTTDRPPGDYRLHVGLYRPDTGERLPLATGGDGVIWIDDFVGARDEGFLLRRGREEQSFYVPAGKHAATSMFEDFTKMVGAPALLEASVRASERTQAWLDAAWASAVANEG